MGSLDLVHSKYFERVATDLNVMPLQVRLRAHPELFDLRPQRRIGKGSPHSRMVDIWARMNAWENVISDWDEARFKPHESVWYPEAAKIPELRPIVYDLMRIVEGDRLGAVLITKLPAGEKIAPHVDGGWHASHYSKFFVPIQNAPGARYCWNDGYIEPELGEAWRFDNSAPHWVDNDSDEDRIALIVCIKTQKVSSMMTVSDMLENLRGHFEIDLRINHIFFPGGYAKEMALPDGYIIGSHRHKAAHTSIYSGGPVIVRTDDNEIELPKGAGSIEMAAHVAHQIEAIGPVQWLCIWETDETDPDKIDAAVIEE